LNRLTEDFFGRRRNLESSNVNNWVQFEVLSKTIKSFNWNQGFFQIFKKVRTRTRGVRVNQHPPMHQLAVLSIG
jgi:hypothetical protein